MKSIEQIAADCGINGADTSLLGAVLSELSSPEGRREERLEEIIGALYRRIEFLEHGTLELDSQSLPDDLISDYKLKDGEPAVWITVGNISVHVRHADEGVALAAYPKGLEASEDAIAECWATHNEAQSEIDASKEYLDDMRDAQ